MTMAEDNYSITPYYPNFHSFQQGAAEHHQDTPVRRMEPYESKIIDQECHGPIQPDGGHSQLDSPLPSIVPSQGVPSSAGGCIEDIKPCFSPTPRPGHTFMPPTLSHPPRGITYVSPTSPSITQPHSPSTYTSPLASPHPSFGDAQQLPTTTTTTTTFDALVSQPSTQLSQAPLTTTVLSVETGPVQLVHSYTGDANQLPVSTAACYDPLLHATTSPTSNTTFDYSPLGEEKPCKIEESYEMPAYAYADLQDNAPSPEFHQHPPQTWTGEVARRVAPPSLPSPLEQPPGYMDEISVASPVQPYRHHPPAQPPSTPSPYSPHGPRGYDSQPSAEVIYQPRPVYPPVSLVGGEHMQPERPPWQHRSAALLDHESATGGHVVGNPRRTSRGHSDLRTNHGKTIQGLLDHCPVGDEDAHHADNMPSEPFSGPSYPEPNSHGSRRSTRTAACRNQLPPSDSGKMVLSAASMVIDDSNMAMQDPSYSDDQFDGTTSDSASIHSVSSSITVCSDSASIHSVSSSTTLYDDSVSSPIESGSPATRVSVTTKKGWRTKRVTKKTAKTKPVGNRRYQCPVCPRRFTRQFNLQSHKNAHEGIRPFQCDYCHWAFTRKNDIGRHLRTKHKDLPPSYTNTTQRKSSGNNQWTKKRVNHGAATTITAAAAAATAAAFATTEATIPTMQHWPAGQPL
ncbi:hypothetical protein DFQ27_003133 [Actinomortierella ambigua]|uniref:C2H2-type domain-containing protein n=1 Tax=Actinomortierella ambigua TaxID=1343610 RepID=A0A9P6U5Y9_9FUNG|nr:hypothetical protein DFQ27_003133 [Actinomortierella ambigua]